MAARTLSGDNVKRDSVGSNTLITATFSDIDDGDTWDSHITEVVGYWLNMTDDPTLQYERASVAYSKTVNGVQNGRFTFHTGEGNRTGELYILAKI